MSDTPRTDEINDNAPEDCADGYGMMRILACQLERENADLREKLAAREADILLMFARREPVEAYLMRAAKGLLPLPDKDKCTDMAKQLGVPDLSALREHDARLLEKLAEKLSMPMGRYHGFEKAVATDILQEVAKRKTPLPSR